MKTTYIKLSLAGALLLGTYSCKKGETTAEYEAAAAKDSAVVVSDSISSAATMNVKDKQFIKTAEVSMEVKDVYDATVSIEKSVQELGGFVTHSDLKSNVVSENTYSTSDEEAVLVKKYESENTMQVRVPTARLGELLTLVNNKKLFLNSRSINAEDVTSGIKYAEMEGKRIKKTGEHIDKLKTNKEKVNMSNNNMAEDNLQQMANMNVTDQLKYSTVDIYIKEPKVRIATIAVTNTESIDDKYTFDFLYSLKSAFVEGFYLIQKIIVGLVAIWPFVLVGAVITYIIRRKKPAKKQQPTTEI